MTDQLVNSLHVLYCYHIILLNIHNLDFTGLTMVLAGCERGGEGGWGLYLLVRFN